jgi:hypothetical protein
VRDERPPARSTRQDGSAAAAAGADWPPKTTRRTCHTTPAVSSSREIDLVSSSFEYCFQFRHSTRRGHSIRNASRRRRRASCADLPKRRQSAAGRRLEAARRLNCRVAAAAPVAQLLVVVLRARGQTRPLFNSLMRDPNDDEPAPNGFGGAREQKIICRLGPIVSLLVARSARAGRTIARPACERPACGADLKFKIALPLAPAGQRQSSSAGRRCAEWLANHKTAH